MVVGCWVLQIYRSAGAPGTVARAPEVRYICSIRCNRNQKLRRRDIIRNTPRLPSTNVASGTKRRRGSSTVIASTVKALLKTRPAGPTERFYGCLWVIANRIRKNTNRIRKPKPNGTQHNNDGLVSKTDFIGSREFTNTVTGKPTGYRDVTAPALMLFPIEKFPNRQWEDLNNFP